jgi:hypothetical protein
MFELGCGVQGSAASIRRGRKPERLALRYGAAPHGVWRLADPVLNNFGTTSASPLLGQKAAKSAYSAICDEAKDE